jgi:cobalt-zinc-cadmium efflux system protein
LSADLHEHAPSTDAKALRIVLLITAVFLGVEAVGGVLSGSLALLADAGHMFTDVASLLLSLIAFKLASRPRSSSRTFGWRRAEIFAAFLNGIALWGIAGLIGYEAVKRISDPVEINDGLMTVVAAAGLLSNIAGGVVLRRAKEHNLNMRGAFLHVLADGLGSLGVLGAALLIAVTGKTFWDPAVSLAISVLIVLSSVRLVRESFNVFMEGVPHDIDSESLEKALRAVPGVLSVHDLHVWTITSGFISLSAHLTVRKGTDVRAVLQDANEALTSRFGIRHSTLQTEEGDEPACPTGTCEGPEGPGLDA